MMQSEVKPDPALAGRFYRHLVTVQDELGKPTGKKEEKIYIEIRARGQKHSAWSGSIEGREEEFKSRFPNAWREFQGDDVEIDGTPIKALPMATPQLIEDFRQMDILSVEQLASLPDGALHDVRDGYRFRSAAQAYLSSIDAFREAEDKEVTSDLIDEPDLTAEPKQVKKKTPRKKTK